MKKLLMAPLLLLSTISFAKEYTTMKTSCIQQSEHSGKTLDQQKEILINQAKQLALTDLYGEMMFSKTDMSNGKITSDEIRQRAVGAVRLKGNPAFYNGKNFGEICADVNAYVTDRDIEKFSPKEVTLTKYCFNDSTVRMNQIKQEAKYGAYKEIISQYKPSLKLTGQQAEKLIHGFKMSNENFDFDTASYCFNVVATILPYELEMSGKFKDITKTNEKKIEKKKEKKQLPNCGNLLDIKKGNYITYTVGGANSNSLNEKRKAINNDKTHSLALPHNWTKKIENIVDFSIVKRIHVSASRMNYREDKTETKIELLDNQCKPLLEINFQPNGYRAYKDDNNTININVNGKLFYKHHSKKDAQYNGSIFGIFSFIDNKLEYTPSSPKNYFETFKIENELSGINFKDVVLMKVTSRAYGSYDKSGAAVSKVKLLD